MVGQLIRLKLRIIWNTVRKQTVVLVLAVLGVLYFGGIYGLVLLAPLSSLAPTRPTWPRR